MFFLTSPLVSQDHKYMRYFIAALGYIILGIIGILIQLILTHIIKLCGFLLEISDSLEMTWVNFILPEDPENLDEDYE